MGRSERFALVGQRLRTFSAFGRCGPCRYIIPILYRILAEERRGFWGSEYGRVVVYPWVGLLEGS